MAESNAERARLAEAQSGAAEWRRWGPYISERAWGSVREDYSADGNAWDYFPHEQARTRAYRWSEDGIGGYCDLRQTICLAAAFWNEHDPYLKERMFGLSNAQGNHGEDVKEYFFYLDGTPTHSYQKMLYKYPQVAYPYDDLLRTNGARSQNEPEYELIDALRDAFTESRYFDIFIEYAKVNSEDILCRITAYNRGPDEAPLHILPHMWYRNTWSWEPGEPCTLISALGPGSAHSNHATLGERWWYGQTSDGQPLPLLFTHNNSNLERLYGVPNESPYTKDAFHRAIVDGQADAASATDGSKLAGHVRAILPPGGTVEVQIRFSAEPVDSPFTGFSEIFAQRIAEADAFYAGIQGDGLTDDEKLIQRQAFAGLTWSKQFYNYDVFRWLSGDPGQPQPPESRWMGRNATWKHLSTDDVIAMPDPWEYPWFASWDLAFHCVTWARIDPHFAKKQLLHMSYEWYQHGNGQFPAYEWNFDDVNPPVLAWAALTVFRTEREHTGEADYDFLAEMFHGLMLNYSWWINRKDVEGRDVFGGGFLGMDNIGVFDRDQPLPGGASLEQSDGTSWMAKLSLNMFAIATELAQYNPIFEPMAVKYFEHFLNITHAMTNMSGEGIRLWDESEKFFFDVIHLSTGENVPLRIFTLVGLIPLLAVVAFDPQMFQHQSMLLNRLLWLSERRPDLVQTMESLRVRGQGDRRLLSVVHGDDLKAVLQRVLNADEFMSDYGVRSVSAFHRDHPYAFSIGDQQYAIAYAPAESANRLFGGNSNWRGPIWFPINYMLVHALREFHHFYGPAFTIEYPAGSGQQVTLDEVASLLSERLISIFRRSAATGRRAVFGDESLFNDDPNWRDCIPFHEYFHGDTGKGLGASHQTGWTALVASLLVAKTLKQDDERT